MYASVLITFSFAPKPIGEGRGSQDISLKPPEDIALDKNSYFKKK